MPCQCKHLSRVNPTNGRIAVGRQTNFATANHEFTGLDKPTIVPPGAQQICLFPCHTICDRKTKWFGNFQRLFLSINGSCKYADTQFCERGTALFISRQKADAEGSPVASIEQHDREVGVDILGKFQGTSVCQVQCQVRKIVTCR